MRAWLSQTFGWSDTTSGIAATVVAVVAILAVRWLFLRWVERRVTDPTLLFRTRRAATYVAAVLIVAALGWIHFEAFDNIATFLGLVSAGLAIALSDVVVNFVGWIYILLRHPFRIGDRIEIDGKAGDVIDLRVFRFSLLEIGGWVHADQFTGRIVHVPNGRVFRAEMANYTEGFKHIFHEVEVPVTYDSNWRKARDLLREVMADHALSEEELEAAHEWEVASRSYFLRTADLEPRVYVTRTDAGVLLTGRLVCKPAQRRAVDSLIWERLFAAIEAEPDIALAYPTIRAYVRDAIAIKPSSSPPAPH